MENLKNNIRKEVSDINKQFFERQPKSDKLYGWYVGEVVNNNDPDLVGKCQIRVYGVFESTIQDANLPWAIPDFDFNGSLVGSFIVPVVGTKVRVYFENGDVYLPIYKGKALDTGNLPTQKDLNYPDNMVFFETDDGDYLTVNRNTKETTYNHNTGTKIIIKDDGTVEIIVVADETKNVTGDVTTTIEGDETKDISGEEKIIAPTITIEGSQVTITGGQLTVNGSVAPNGTGPFCGIPFCLFTNTPQTGNVVIGT